MRSVISDEKFGQIVYEESAWTGRKSIYVNGKPLSKIAKNTYFLSDGEMRTNFVVQGNYLKGSKLLIEGRGNSGYPTRQVVRGRPVGVYIRPRARLGQHAFGAICPACSRRRNRRLNQRCVYDFELVYNQAS